MVGEVSVGLAVINRQTKLRGVVQVIHDKKKRAKPLRVKYEDGRIRYEAKNDLDYLPSVSKARCLIDGLSEEQLARVRKTAEMVGLPLRETAEEMAAAGLLEVTNDDSGAN